MDTENLAEESRQIHLEVIDHVKSSEPDFETLNFLLAELQARRVLLKMLEAGELAPKTG